MTQQRYTCEWCGEHLDPRDRVVESVSQDTLETPELGNLTIDGEPFIYHENHWIPSFGRQTYRGPLRDHRPGAI